MGGNLGGCLGVVAEENLKILLGCPDNYSSQISHNSASFRHSAFPEDSGDASAGKIGARMQKNK
jgi:hypothetical protein